MQNALAPGAASAVRDARSSGFRHRAAVPDLCDGAAASYRRCETPEVPRDFKTTEGAKGTRSRVRLRIVALVINLTIGPPESTEPVARVPRNLPL